MPEKSIIGDPSTIGWITYGWVLLLAWLGGVVNYIKKLNHGIVTRFNVTEFIGDIITSGFSGVLTFYLCQAAEFNQFLTASLVGVSGHMGSRAIFMFETWAAKKFDDKH